MKTISKLAAQGDILIEVVAEIPSKTKAEESKGAIIVAHSETGHHHSINDKRVALLVSDDPFVCYLRVDGEYADLVHHRDVNPHETIRLPTGCYRIRKQREWTPEGWRRVDD